MIVNDTLFLLYIKSRSLALYPLHVIPGYPRVIFLNSSSMMLKLQIALQIDVTSTPQVAEKQSPMRVCVNHVRRLWRPYPPDTQDNVQVRIGRAALYETLCECDCLPIRTFWLSHARPARQVQDGDVP